MTRHPADTTNILVPIGALGTGIREELVEAGIAQGAHAIACDAGSTDSGPAYLATGKSKYSRSAVKRDLGILMRIREKSGIPLLIGSCGTSGCDMALDWTRDLAIEIAREHGLKPRIALLYSELDPSLVKRYADMGRVTPLAPMTGVDASVFSECDHIVALMGPEPYIAALEAGADIVLGGRTTDTAVLAAVALKQGAGKGPAWHASKTAECGGVCTVYTRDGGVSIRIGRDAFEVEPLSATNRCTPQTVSAHMLYENTDPFRLIEPGGILDVTKARYTPVDERVVRVEGSQWKEMPYTMKLEGAGGGLYQTIMLVGIQSPEVLAEIDFFVSQMQKMLESRVDASMGKEAGNYHISLRPYGHNAISGMAVPSTASPPREVGLLFVATASSQALATQIAKTCNSMFFHMPLRPEMELPSYAFPFSPAEIERGQVFEFKLNHVVHIDDPLELVRMKLISTEMAENA
jgi:hypothetical protein